jgi:hypothetical protein
VSRPASRATANEARGLDILVLGDDRKIRALYQFAEPTPPAV